MRRLDPERRVDGVHALAHDVFTRPQGAWARATLHLAVLPALAAWIGLGLARWLPLGLPALALSLGSSLLLLGLLRSPLAPAISAGLLPVALRARSPWYPASILLVTATRAGAVALLAALRRASLPPVDLASRIDDPTEGAASGWRWRSACCRRSCLGRGCPSSRRSRCFARG